MATFLALPLPAPLGDGAGASVAIAAGTFPTKTFSIAGTFDAAKIALEVSEDNTNWGRIAERQPGQDPVEVAFSAAFARIFIVGYRNGTPVPYLGVDGTGSNQTATLPVNPSGPGAAVNVSSFTPQKSIVVTGTPEGNPRGALIIEGSFDNLNWLPLAEVLPERTNGEPLVITASIQFMRTNSGGGVTGMAVTVMSTSQAATGTGSPYALKFSGKYTDTTTTAKELADMGFPYEAINVPTLGGVPYPMPAGEAQRLRVNATLNTRTATTTIEIYKNGVATGILVSIGAATTGLFTATGAVAFAAGDRLSLRITGSGTGTLRVSATVDYAKS